MNQSSQSMNHCLSSHGMIFFLFLCFVCLANLSNTPRSIQSRGDRRSCRFLSLVMSYHHLPCNYASVEKRKEEGRHISDRQGEKHTLHSRHRLHRHRATSCSVRRSGKDAVSQWCFSCVGFPCHIGRTRFEYRLLGHHFLGAGCSGT